MTDFSNWKPTEQQNYQIKQFIKDLNKSGLGFTEFKIHLTEKNEWHNYSDICKNVQITNRDNYSTFVKMGLKAFAYRAVKESTGYNSNKKWMMK